MNKLLFFIACIFLSFSEVTLADAIATNTATTNSTSSSQNAGNAQNIFFNTAKPSSHTRVDTTPNLYAAPSAFGFSQNNCGGSDTAGVGWTGFVIGGSHAREMFDCNTRADTIILWQLGLQDAAKVRMVCFGSDLTRKAYETAGGTCPNVATAKGIEGAPAIDLGFQPIKSSSGQVNKLALSENDQAIREKTQYWGTDPIVMKRLGIAH